MCKLYIVEYTFDDLTGKFWRYSLEGAREFITKNSPESWVLWCKDKNGLYILDKSK